MDVYLQVWRQWDRYHRARGTVMAWIFTICRSRALDLLRRRDPTETHADPYALRGEPCTDSDPLLFLRAGRGEPVPELTNPGL